jgi:1-acyl-sn-glycerol-3-phosphate acyltransferase
MTNPRLYIRSLRLIWHLGYAILLACIYPHLDRDAQQKRLKLWSKKLLDILNVQMHISGNQAAQDGRGRLFVANHISWLDVFVISVETPAKFVAKSEVRGWPLVGWLVRRFGTQFIERGARLDTARVNQCLKNLLDSGEDVALFPQGTSTVCSTPVHFHASLLQSAIDADSLVQPMAIYYFTDGGTPLSEVAFTGDMSFGMSLWSILKIPKIDVNLILLPGIPCQEMSRRIVSRVAQEVVNRALHSKLMTSEVLSQHLGSPIVCVP